MKTSLFALLSALLCIGVSNAQTCTLSATGANNAVSLTINNVAGQSFNACQNGHITSITINLENGSTAGTHTLRIGPSANAATSILPNTAYSQTFNTMGGVEVITINLNTPFPVSNGSSYSFDITAGSIINLGTNTNASIPNSQSYSLNGLPSAIFRTRPEQSLIFSLTIQGEATTIPTLGEWGIIILSIMLIVVGVVYKRNHVLSELM